MPSPKLPADPFTVVAQALCCSRESISIESGMYRDHGWDSFGHISVIVALEEAYDIAIKDEQLVHLRTMKAILELVERLPQMDQYDQ